jgi:hypothetical protein
MAETGGQSHVPLFHGLVLFDNHFTSDPISVHRNDGAWTGSASQVLNRT